VGTVESSAGARNGLSYSSGEISSEVEGLDGELMATFKANQRKDEAETITCPRNAWMMVNMSSSITVRLFRSVVF
jgi:hypothetical protein